MDLKDQIGFYVNTLALQSEVDGVSDFRQFLDQVKVETVQAYDHQSYPFDLLVDELDLEHELSRNPLFDVMLSVREEEREQQAPDVELFNSNQANAKFDLTFAFSVFRDGIILSVDYATSLYTGERVAQYLAHFRQLMTSLLTAPDAKLKAHELIVEDQKALLSTVNAAAISHYPLATAHALFSEQAALHKDHVAIEFDGITLSYEDLERQSNQVAHMLMEHGVKRSEPVALLLDRSPSMIVCLLGILKAGACYLPIDVESPAERIEFVLSDSAARLLLTEPLENKPDVSGVHAIDITATDLSQFADSKVAIESDPAD